MTAARPLSLCPVCRRPAQARTAPFCSARCADVDLGRWLTGQYRVPGAPDDAETDAEADATAARLDPAAERG